MEAWTGASVLSSEALRVNGLSCFIRKEQRLYAFLGCTAQAAFNGCQPSGPAQAPAEGTLRQALQGFGVPNDRLEACAVLDGMNPEHPLAAGTLVKFTVK